MARKKKLRHRRQSRPQHQAGNTNDSSDDSEGYLMIGGVRINVTPHGNVAGMSNTKTRHQQRNNHSSSDDESPLEPGEMDSDDMLDYLQNIGATRDTESEDEGNEGGTEEDILATSTGRRRHFEMLRRFGGVEIGDEGAPEDIIGRFYDDDEEEESSEEDSEATSDSFDNSSEDGAHSLSSFSSDDNDEDDALMLEEEEMDVDNNQGVLTLEELEQLPTATRYPVAVRPTVVLVSGEKQGAGPPGGGSKKKNGKKTGRNSGGKFAPGEKARLRREKIEAKRAGRAMVRGFDLASINKELEAFVLKQQDMHAFPPMPKHECRQVQKLAALYGCKAGAQGSGKKRSVMVVMTERTAVPEGAALLEIGKLLTAHTASELGTRGNNTTPAIPGLWVGAPGASQEDSMIKTGKGRWADFRKKGPRSSKSTARKRQEQHDSAALASRRKHLRPVNFVSKGAINLDDESFEVIPPGEEESLTEEEESERGDIEEEDAGRSLLPVFEDRRGGSTSDSLSARSGGEDQDQEIDVDDDFRPMLGSSIPTVTTDEARAAKSKRKKEMQKRKKENARFQASGLLPYSSRGADVAEGITNSGRLLGLGMALGIGAQVFNTAPADDDDESTPTVAIADLSPLEPMLSKTAAKKLAKQKTRRHSNTDYNTSFSGGRGSFVAVSSPTRAVRRTTANTTPGLGGAGGGAGVSGDYGDFEAHTSGIGSKLLAKWGFAGAGSGLGRGGTGISEPLQVKMRAKGLGLGAER